MKKNSRCYCFLHYNASRLNTVLLTILLCFNFLSLKTYSQTEQGILKGFVADKKTDQKLSSASILILNTDKGAISNLKGYFELQLPPGEYIAEVRMLGYVPLRKQCRILPDEKTSLFFDLEATSISTDEVSITGKRYDSKIKSKSYELLPGDLKNIPQFGEADPFRAVQALPGITSINDFGNQLYLRGGNFDETLISLDDVPLYNPYHLGGIFSSVNSDIISKEKIYLSNYPQTLGGYLSGALELSSKTGQRDTIRTSASLGLLSSRGFIEGPLWKGSFIASARRTYLDAVNLFYDKAVFPYYFYDLYTKYSLPLDNKNIFYVSGFYSSDVLKEELKAKKDNELVAPKWGNLLLSSKWIHLPEDNSEFSIQLYLSQSFLNSDEMENSTYFDNLIRDVTLKAEYNFSQKRNLFQFGVEYKYLALSYSWFDNYYSKLREYINPPEEAFFDYAPNPYDYKKSTGVISSYFTAQLSLSDLMLLKAGLRGCYISSIKSFIPLASVSVEYNMFYNTTLSLSYGRYYQFLYTLKEKRPESLYSPFSVYFLSEDRNSIANSDHYSAGINITDIIWGMDADIEAYYKARDNLASSYSDHPRIRFEDGYAAGVDFLLKKENGIVTGWLGYSFGKSVKRNDLYSYYSNYDRRHTFKILLEYQLSEKWKISTFWTYATGTPYTDIVGLYLGGMDFRTTSPSYSYSRTYDYFSWRLIDGAKNNLRLDDHHRLDLGITGSFIWGSFLIHPYLQVLNVYSSSNQIIINNNIQDHANESFKFQSSFIIPTLGVNIEF